MIFFQRIFAALAFILISTHVHSQTLCFDAANDNRYETAEGCFDLGVVDMNGDGHLDIVASGGSLASIHLGNGDGTFEVYYTSAPGTNADLEMVDFDDDGDLDFYSYGSGNCVAGRNLGNGTFEWAGYQGVTLLNNQMSEMSVGDVTGEGSPSVVVNDQGGGLFVITTGANGIPDASFALDVLPNPTNVTVGDLNGDAITDIVCASASSDNIGIYLGQGGQNFTEIIVDAGTTIGSGYASIELTDIDGDGDNDILVGGYTVMYVLRNDGGNAFTSLADVFMGSFCQGSIAGDWDNDGDNDVAWANNSSGGVTIQLNNGNGTFPATGNIFYSSNGPSQELASGDFDDDGELDLIVANGIDGNFAFLKGHGDGSFGSKTLLAGYSAQGLAAADFDNDNDVDVVATNGLNPSELAISFNTGDGTFAETIFLPNINNAGECVAADFNSDGNADIAVHSQNGYAVHLGNGNGTFQAWDEYPTTNMGAGGDRTIEFGDFDNDGNLDLAGSRPGDDEVNVVMGNGDGSFDAPITLSGAGYPRTLHTQDFDEDDLDDLIVCSNTTDEVWIYFSLGNGTFSAVSILPTPGNPEGLTSFDADEDGIPDLIVGCPNSNTLFTFLGNGNGTFQLPLETNIPTGSNSSRIEHADINFDGHQDILSALYQIDAVGVFFGNGDGTFESAITYEVDQAPNRIVTADFNNDGAIDFSTLNSGIFNISVVLNNAAFITADGELAFCEGQDVVLSASEGFSYSWNTGANTQTIIVIENGEFFCEITNQAGDCTLVTPTVEVEVFIPTEVTFELSDDVVCDTDESFFLSGGLPFGGQFSGLGIVANVFDPSVTGPGEFTITYNFEDTGGCTVGSASDLITVQDCVNVAEGEKTPFSIYPTITTAFFTLESVEPFSLTLYDSFGRMVQSENSAADRAMISVADLASGIYFVWVKSLNHSAVFRVQKVH